MPVGSTYQLAVDQSLHGVLCTNIFYWTQTQTGSGDDEQDLIDAFKEDGTPAWQACLSDEWQITCYRARRVSGTGTFAEKFEVATGIDGDLTGAALPANAVAVISWYSETYSKAGRGRSYFSGCQMIDELENTWNSTQYALLELLGFAIQDGVADSVSGAIFDRTLWGGNPATAKPVVKREVRAQVRKLRGRTTRSCVTA